MNQLMDETTYNNARLSASKGTINSGHPHTVSRQTVLKVKLACKHCYNVVFTCSSHLFIVTSFNKMLYLFLCCQIWCGLLEQSRAHGPIIIPL